MIKASAQTAFFDKHPKQAELAEALGEAFDVTHGSYAFGQFFWICSANKNTVERFGFSREVVALYTPHQKPDARLLTAVGDFLNSEDLRDRAEKVVVLAIHDCPKESIDALVSNETDRIIVPIFSQDLSSKHRGSFFVRNRIAERVGKFDLFGMSSPIKHDRYFYGRQSLVQELVTRALAQKEQSGLFGLRKTGKTSVLFAIQRRLETTKAICEYVDCQNPGIYGGRWWQVLEEITKRISAAADNRTSGNNHSWKDYSSTNAANEFSAVVKSILQNDDINQIVLLLDEVEFITPGISNNLGKHWDEDFQPFWQTIRSTSQETGGKLTFVVAGVNPSSVEQPNFGEIPNPIFQLAVPYYLEPLATPVVRDMVRSIGKYSGVAFEEACFNYLKETYGGHPYLIRLACSEVVRAHDTADMDVRPLINQKSFEKNTDSIKARLSQPMKDILLSLIWWYPEEYELLRILADDEGFAMEFLSQNEEMRIRFAKYGLLDNTRSTFSIRDMRDFLINHGEKYKESISPFKRGDLPPAVLPSIPNLEDLAALFERRTKVEMALRTLLITVFGFATAFDDQAISKKIVSGFSNSRNGSDPAQLFVGRRPQDAINEIYLSDLKPIFTKNWEMFKPYFGQKPERFEMNMDTINIARRIDAHTKPITETDKENFINSFNWFLGILTKVPGIIQNK